MQPKTVGDMRRNYHISFFFFFAADSVSVAFSGREKIRGIKDLGKTQ